jgi:predicted ATP-grasp superfamily ATP-dependent carboligase
MPLNPSGQISLGGPVAGQSIAVELGLSPTASISLNQTAVRTLAQVPSGAIIMPTNFYGNESNIRQCSNNGFTRFGEYKCIYVQY